MNDFSLAQKTPQDILVSLVKKIKYRRKKLKITQLILSQKSDVSLASIKRFEQTGEISLKFLIKIAIVLNCEEDFNLLFNQKIYNSIEDVINEKRIN